MPESRGRPGSASQRPTGGDKAVLSQKKQYFRRKKVCRFCVEKIDDINYKDVKMLNAFVAERGKMLNGVTVTISQKAGENEQLFGSVTSKDVAEALEMQHFTIDRRKIQLDDPIKQLGEHKLAIRLHKDVTVEVTVNVVREG